MASYVTPKKNAEYIFYISLVSQSTGQFQGNPTLAAGDFKVSIDGGTLNNLATLPTVTPAASKAVKVTLSASEMNGDNIVVIGSDAAGAEWDDVFINIQTSARQIDDLAFPTTSGRSIDVTAGGEVGVDWANIGSPTTTVNLSGTTIKTATDVETDTADIQSRLPAALVSGRMDSSVGAMADNTLTAAALAADAVTEIQSGLATSSALADIQSDTNDIQSRLPASLSGDGFIKADLKSIEDELTSGNNATLNLKQLNIQNSAGKVVHLETSLEGSDAVFVKAPLTGGIGLHVAGEIGASMEGNVNGLYISGDEDAVYIESIGANGNGIYVTGIGTGKSINTPQDIALPSGDLDDQLQALPTAAENATSVWAAGTRTLTSFGTLVTDIWANASRTLTAISDSAGVTTLLSRIGGALNITGGKVESNVKQINDADVTGDGSGGNPWGPA